MANDLPTQESDREARIRERAYHLWESDGKPYGRDVEFWQRARQLVAREQDNLQTHAEPEAVKPVPAAPVATPAPARAAAPTARRRKPPASRKPPKS